MGDRRLEGHPLREPQHVRQGLFVGLEVFPKPGQCAVIQTPIYPPFLHSTQQTKRRQVLTPLV